MAQGYSSFDLSFKGISLNSYEMIVTTRTNCGILLCTLASLFCGLIKSVSDFKGEAFTVCDTSRWWKG